MAQVTRGRGQLTLAEKALARPPVTRRGSNQQLPQQGAAIISTAPATAAPEVDEQLPPTSVGRLATKLKAAAVLGRKASALPAPTATRSAIAKPKRPGDSDAVPPVAPPSTRIRDAFVAAFAEDRVESLEELLKFRSKASKFNAKARQDEQLGYIRQLKAAVRAVCDEVRDDGGRTFVMCPGATYSPTADGWLRCCLCRFAATTRLSR